ncbi:MAG: hypothetical protein M0017_10080 [Desulfobacteraceae bacterium]|nr:hypothetical protein [Desulfobacteraceae bacterium]
MAATGFHLRATPDWRLPPPLRRVGIVGIPPLAVIRDLNDRGVEIHDLDALLVAADLEESVAHLPRVYCAILRTAVLNALRLELDAIYIDVGPGKCDGAFQVAAVLAETLPIPVVRTVNDDTRPFGVPLCKSRLPLLEKFQRITEGVKMADPGPPLSSCVPTAGFWGVPPRDFSILSLFPDTTHVYGWTRCMENKTPADAGLEAFCNPEVPTVFFAQSFCAKTALARLLAGRHPRALCLDVDVHTGSSARAKVEAFLELTGGRR